MPINMKIWEINGKKLVKLPIGKVSKESYLESWICEDPSIIDSDVLIISRQKRTAYGKQFDLLAIDIEGDLHIIELKRERTSRDVVAQTLDYASWVNDLTTNEIESLALEYLNKELASAFFERFEVDLPENLNSSHRMVIVASELDHSTERIIKYLAECHAVNINVVFFNFFKTPDGKEFLGRAWLMDPTDVERKSETRKKGEWSGFWYVNVGQGAHRSWNDCRRYGFLSAGQGRQYRDQITKLKTREKVFAYLSGEGYVGYGIVTKEAVPVRDFIVEAEGKKLLDLGLEQPNIKENSEDDEKSEYIVGIEWKKTFEESKAKTFEGIFRYQKPVCKLYTHRKKTLDFLIKQFNVEEEQ